MNVVEQLLLGSANLNTMQAEITKIVKMLTNPLKEEEFDEFNFWALEDTIQWTLMPGRNGVWIEVATSSQIYCNEENVLNFKANDIQQVHASLETFVAAFFEAFPAVRAKLEPVLAAAA